jgi:hypothetical protein
MISLGIVLESLQLHGSILVMPVPGDEPGILVHFICGTSPIESWWSLPVHPGICVGYIGRGKVDVHPGGTPQCLARPQLASTHRFIQCSTDKNLLKGGLGCRTGRDGVPVSAAAPPYSILTLNTISLRKPHTGRFRSPPKQTGRSPQSDPLPADTVFPDLFQGSVSRLHREDKRPGPSPKVAGPLR